MLDWFQLAKSAAVFESSPWRLRYIFPQRGEVKSGGADNNDSVLSQDVEVRQGRWIKVEKSDTGETKEKKREL